MIITPENGEGKPRRLHFYTELQLALEPHLQHNVENLEEELSLRIE